MGVELDLSELAVLRPIQTSAGSGGAATARRGNDDLDAADTGCVTPTAVSSLLPRQVGFGVGVGIDVVESVFSTPTSSPCLLRPATVCPPAPRKPARSPAAAAAKRKRCCDRPGLQRPFFPVPQDLSTVFVPRGPADRSPPPRAAKKIRRLFVVG
ncbi:hypothetical protein GQ55_4G059800 [Panicum hallii var. hallii]|uniref:Uncharacterized protein n=2 Tax=Panicum hallii TaxID=206008 RepID=A0A2T7DVQ2_9POAL|nr:uncharacterized protein LOC112890150 [Panicum hallii]PAN22973.1 hypothetical protein PAHAL_4G057100 [Panicum hallii]PUZ59658.1 hypothetical protein GQ55_4G059800 [Panicum hallii var. hallii]